MKEFSIVPKIYMCDRYEEFFKKFSVNTNDLIITAKFLFDRYLNIEGSKANVIFQDEYGLGEPTDIMVEKMYNDAKKYNYKRVIAIGGGTIIDIAKLFCLRNILPIADLFDGKIEIEKDKDLIIIPTTCGTGSEVTNISIVNLLSKNTKKGLVLKELYPESAILIEELVLDLPVSIFATSSIDALVHAVESALSPKATEYSEIFSYEAIRKILEAYVNIKKEGLESRKKYVKDILVASNLAGVAFGNAGCGTVHAMSYPLGGRYHVSHGESNYVLFLGVLRYYNQKFPLGKIKKLNEEISKILDCRTDEVYIFLEELLNILLKKKKISEYGVKEEELLEFTQIVEKQQQRLMANSYIPLNNEEILRIYKNLY